MDDYQIEMLWRCSVCQHLGNRGLKDRYCCNCGHKKDDSDGEYMPPDMTAAAALSGDEERRAQAGRDWICKYCEANQSQLSKCCGNCGGEREGTQLVSPRQAEEIAVQVREDFADAQRETARISRELDAWSAKRARVSTAAPSALDPERPRSLAWAAWAAAALGLALLLVWLFMPREVSVRVTGLSWRHDTIVERYQVWQREGWQPAGGSFDVMPLGLRHHHYDHVHVGSHRESYQDRYACGETCSTSPSYTTCSSNGNGTARCTKHGGSRSCSTKYCTRTAYRTVEDYQDVSRQQMWYGYRVWDWGYHRTITKSGHTPATAWPTEDEVKQARIADGEKERSHREASYEVTFQDEDDTYKIAPASLQEFGKYALGQQRKLKVVVAGGVEVLP